MPSICIRLTSEHSQPPLTWRSARVGPQQAGASRTAVAGAVAALDCGRKNDPPASSSVPLL